MRVAIHYPDGAVAAYKLGRIEDGVHNAPVGHPAIPIDRFMADLAAKAKAEFPEAKIVIERLVEGINGKDAEWVSDISGRTKLGAGNSIPEKQLTSTVAPTIGEAH